MLDHGYDDAAWTIGRAFFDPARAASHARANAFAAQNDKVRKRPAIYIQIGYTIGYGA